MNKIKSIRLINFQSHEDTFLELSEGLNVFMGQSRQGKTSVIRALRWVLTNQPRGNDFIREGCGNCSVTLNLSNGSVIERIRKPGFNGYVVDNKELKALQGSVPGEVTNLMNTSELNWQFEHDSPFLLNESSGEVAKRLNAVAGLQEIDASVGNINAWIRSNNAKTGEVESSLEQAESSLSEYDHLPLMKKDLDSLEKQENNLIGLEEDERGLKESIERLSGMSEEINHFRQIADELSIIRKWENAEEELSEIKKRLAPLTELLDSFDEVLDEMERCESVYSRKDLKKIEGLMAEQEALSKKDSTGRELGLLVGKLHSIQQEMEQWSSTIKETAVLLPRQCPMCGNLLDPPSDS